MRKTLILHGWQGSPIPHWQSHLACELAKDYGTVSFPLLKDKDAPKKEIWMKQVEKILKDFKPNVVVCHSVANTLWFHLCQENKAIEIKELFLVAPPSLTCDIQELNSFFPISLPKNLYSKKITLITSTNDPYLSQNEAQHLANSLHVKHVVLENAGHINIDSGYGWWEDIVKMVKSRY